MKILEIEPINFLLRSDEEQYNIISSFANWLKISPIQMQFKSMTRKADSNKHVALLEEELEREENEQCKAMGRDYIRLIKDIGNKEALSRRFFLLFEYEPVAGRRGRGDYAEIYSVVNTAVQNCKTYMLQCGNTIVEPEDEDFFSAEILYSYFNRKSAIEEPFTNRLQRVVMDTMMREELVVGVDDVPNIPVASFIAPRGVDLTHYNYVVMDGTYYTYLYVKKNGYPNTVRGGWMSSLVNAGEGIDIDIHLQREGRSKTLDKVAQRIRLNKTKLKGIQDTSTDYEELTNSIRSGYFIKHNMSNYNEDLFYMSIFITVSGNSLDELMWRKQQMVDLLKSMDLFTQDCHFQQEAALRSVMPLLSMDDDLAKKSKRNVLTSGAASTYPFTSFEMSDENGILLGVNRHNNSLCIVDLFNSKVHKNANVTILGTTGAGKTVLMQVMALRMRLWGIQSFIIAPIKGHEFKRACSRIGGEYIKLSPSSQHCINIMEIRQTLSPDMELIDEIEYQEQDSLLARKIQQLLIFFYLLVPDITNEEEQMVDEALIKTYTEFGITHDNTTLYEKDIEKFKVMPVLGDLYKHLKENPMTQRVAAILSRFVTGSAQSFNQQTNVRLDNKYTVIDISENKGKLLPIVMMIAADYVYDIIKADRTKKKALFLDEMWQLIGASANRHAADFCVELYKIIRGYGGGVINASQDLGDYFSLDDGKYGRAILNNSKNKIVLNLEPDEAAYVKDVLKLTRTEIRNITQFERGEALISSNNNKIPVAIKISDVEKELITTDRSELAEILERRKQGLAEEM